MMADYCRYTAPTRGETRDQNMTRAIKTVKGVSVKRREGTYAFFTVKHVAEVFVGLRVLADESEYPFIGFVVGTEGYPV